MRPSLLLLLGVTLAPPAFAQGRGKAPPPPPNPSTAKRTAAITGELKLVYNKDVGYATGAEDDLPIGPDYLTAGADGQVALYDAVRDEVIVAELGKGVVGRFAAGQIDGLGWAPGNKVVLMDGSVGQLNVYETDGTKVATHDVQENLPDGATLSLHNGVITVHRKDGSAKDVAVLVDGKPVPIAQQKDVTEAAIKLTPSGGVTINGEAVEIGDSVKASFQVIPGRPPWIEVEAVNSNDDGSIRVDRWAARVGVVPYPLPVATEGYRPSFDVATDSAGALYFLDPGPKAVRVVRVEVQ
ncbi:MAG: hypothetical protein H6739_18495 [Alphaproteobacteria bacterium]|nr:hypothetical protein [Alphaproteobacteria bacterium]